jgi:tetratricopeptide (TPR) repeat protein
MRAEDLYQSLMNWPSSTALVVIGIVGVVLFALSLFLLSFPRLRWPARVTLFIAFALIGFDLLSFQDQTVSAPDGKYVIITRPRYRERYRLMAQAGLLGIPFVIVAGVAGYLSFERRNNRTTLPGHLRAGRRFMYDRNYEAALAEFNKMIRLAPYLGAAYLGRAEVYYGMGSPELALADLDRALGHDPRLSSGYLLRGRIRTELGDVDGALSDFGRKMLIQGDNAEFYLCRGVCLAKKGQLAEAAADFRRVLKLTNHSDFADPAKAYLKQLETDQGAFAANISFGNGTPAGPAATTNPAYPPLR